MKSLSISARKARFKFQRNLKSWRIAIPQAFHFSLKLKMKTIYDVAADKYNNQLAEALKKLEEFKVPEWASFVKTSVARSRPPFETDFWYKRAASILRQIYIKGVVGVNRLKTRYGGRKKRGVRPAEFRRGSGKIIRVILQQAEKAGLLMKSETKKKGRQMTKKGLEFLNKVAEKVFSESVQKPKVSEVAEEVK